MVYNENMKKYLIIVHIFVFLFLFFIISYGIIFKSENIKIKRVIVLNGFAYDSNFVLISNEKIKFTENFYIIKIFSDTLKIDGRIGDIEENGNIILKGKLIDFRFDKPSIIRGIIPYEEENLTRWMLRKIFKKYERT